MKPWIVSYVPGHKEAIVVNANGAARIIKRAERPAMVIGSTINEKMIEYAKLSLIHI